MVNMPGDSQNDPSTPPPIPESLYQEPESEANRNKPLAIIAAVGILVGVVMYVLNQDKQAANQQIALLEAPTSQTRVRPVDPQGMAIPYQDKIVYSAIDTSGVDLQTIEDLAKPLPEDSDASDDTADIPVIEKFDPQTRTVIIEQETPAPAQTLPKPVRVVSEAQTEAVEKPVQVASIQPKPAPVAAAPSATATAAIAKGSYGVQLGAFRSAEQADAGWKKFQSRYGSALDGLSKSVEKADIPGKGTFWRVRAMGGSKAAADAACTRIKTAGGSCMVVK